MSQTVVMTCGIYANLILENGNLSVGIFFVQLHQLTDDQQNKLYDCAFYKMLPQMEG